MAPAVFLGLGSNLGDREAAIAGALERLLGRGFRATRTSSLWLTEPVGGPPQGLFLNAAAGGETDLTPEALLEACLDTEREMGRLRTVRNGPRTIDVDILLFGDERREGTGLEVPQHDRVIDAVLRHFSVGRPFAAGDGEQARVGDVDRVVAG